MGKNIAAPWSRRGGVRVTGGPQRHLQSGWHAGWPMPEASAGASASYDDTLTYRGIWWGPGAQSASFCTSHWLFGSHWSVLAYRNPLGVGLFKKEFGFKFKENVCIFFDQKH